MVTQHRRYGASIVSLMTWNWFVWRKLAVVERAIAIMREAGLDCLQMLPVYGTDADDLQEYHSWIVSREDAWNFGTWPQAFRRFWRDTRGLPSEHLPTWIDLLFFRAAQIESSLGSMFVVHRWDETGVLEISRRCSTNHRVYLEEAKLGREFCLDTSHILEIPEWQSLLTKLPEGSVKLVHVNLTMSDIAKLLIHRHPKLCMVLSVIATVANEDAPVIIEIKPIPVDFVSVWLLRNIKKELAPYFG